MPLVTSTQILRQAQLGGYAIGAFNFENMEMAMAVVKAAEQLHSPVIMQTTPSTVRYGGLGLFSAIVKCLADKSGVPIALHLDHGSSFEQCAGALKAGYTSIMIDGSKLPLAENIALTKSVAMMCNAVDISVEGELGQVGGKEDDTESVGGGYTIAHEAVEFERETGVGSLAVGVGTAHGFYPTAPILNTGLISELRGLIRVPMVLHGASGLSDEALKDCISRGICKINFATDLRVAYSDGVKSALKDNPELFDPKEYGKSGMERVREIVKSRILVCGSDGKA